MKIIQFNEINFSAFGRIWDSIYRDRADDSWKTSLLETPEAEWSPVFQRWKSVMKEISLDGEPCGYIFLSSKSDGTAHLGYGLYENYRGKGLMLRICRDFLREALPLLNKNISTLVATTLEANLPSQKILLSLGFEFVREKQDVYQEKELRYFEYRKSL